VVLSLATAVTIAVFLIGVGYAAGGSAFFAAHPDAEGAFYALMPHAAMAWLFGVPFAFAVVALGIGAARFWSDTEERSRDFASAGPLSGALADAATLKYLGGGGDGCTYPDERPSRLRRAFHHLTFYGFSLCFAATCVATVYHYVLRWPAPYPLASWPVVLGTIGGVGLLAGPAGLLWLRAESDSALTSPRQTGMDLAFLVLLMLVGSSGLSLLALRQTAAMGVLLAAHLGTVMAWSASARCPKSPPNEKCRLPGDQSSRIKSLAPAGSAYGVNERSRLVRGERRALSTSPRSLMTDARSRPRSSP